VRESLRDPRRDRRFGGCGEEHRARLALQDLGAWPVDRIPHSTLLQEAWKHRHNVSAFDAGDSMWPWPSSMRHRSSPRHS
jgi:hypothetical protein